MDERQFWTGTIEIKSVTKYVDFISGGAEALKMR